MPQFAIHKPVSISYLRDQINKDKLHEYSKPIGVIGENLNYSYGYEGDGRYYVTAGILGELVCGRMKLTFDQSKQLFDALNFSDMKPEHLNYNNCISALKIARKNKIEGKELFWLFLNAIRSVQ
jgi:hypothetical protein